MLVNWSRQHILLPYSSFLLGHFMTLWPVICKRYLFASLLSHNQKIPPEN